MSTVIMTNLLCILIFVVAVSLLKGYSAGIGVDGLSTPVVETTTIEPNKTNDPKKVADNKKRGGGEHGGALRLSKSIHGFARGGIANGALTGAVGAVASGILDGGDKGILDGIKTGGLDGIAADIPGSLSNSSAIPDTPVRSVLKNLGNVQTRCDKLRYLPGCIVMDVFMAIAGSALPV